MSRLIVPPNYQKITVIIEDLQDRNRSQKYVFPVVENFEITTYQDHARWDREALDFSFKGTACIDETGKYAYVHTKEPAEGW